MAHRPAVVPDDALTRRKGGAAGDWVLAMENGLFSTSATCGMPMVVELGIALDVLVGTLILGIFLPGAGALTFDLRHMEKLKEGSE